MVPNNEQQTQAKTIGVTLRASAFKEDLLARSCCHQLICLSKYHMHQQTTAVDQPPFSVVFNMADNTLDGFDVSGVQGSSLQVIRNWQCPIHVGEISLNLLNNSKTNVFRPLRFKFFAFGNGDDDNIQKLPEE